MSRTAYICTLPRDVQEKVARALVLAGIGGDDFARAMNSRLCDLEDTIDVRRFA